MALSLKDLVGVSDLKVLTWIHNQHIKDSECSMGAVTAVGGRSVQSNCPGDCSPIIGFSFKILNFRGHPPLLFRIL